MKTILKSSLNQGGGYASGIYKPADLYYISLEADGVFLGSSIGIDATVNNYVSVTSEDADGNEADYFDLTF